MWDLWHRIGTAKFSDAVCLAVMEKREYILCQVVAETCIKAFFKNTEDNMFMVADTSDGHLVNVSKHWKMLADTKKSTCKIEGLKSVQTHLCLLRHCLHKSKAGDEKEN